MSSAFILKPNYKSLHKHGYRFVSEVWFDEEVKLMIEQGTKFECKADYDAVRDRLEETIANEAEPRIIDFTSENFYTDEKRLRVEEGFKSIVNEYGLTEHYDTLLFVVLAEFDHAWLNLNHIWDNQNSKLKAKELAQLLLLYHNTPKGKSIEIVFKPQIGDTVKIKDDALSKWIGNLIKEAFENGNFPLGQFGEDIIQMFTGIDNPINLEHNHINIPRLEAAAITSVRSFAKYQRKYFTLFAYQLWRFLNDTTYLRAAHDKKFSDEQLRFLFDVSALFNWINPEAIDSPPADYMSSVFSNYVKKQLPI